jgi:hypothetical protein
MLPLAFVFPADPLRPARVDDAFAAQAAALRAAGWRVWLVSERGHLEPRGDDVAGAVIVYRGWMMTPAAYAAFAHVVERAGATLLVSPEEYRANHHIDGWVTALAGLTPETVLVDVDDDVVAVLRQLSWDQYFLKDFVKSLKTARGSIATSVDDAVALLSEFKRYRDIEGGIAIRRVEDFVVDSERRFFVLRGCLFGPDDAGIPAIVDDVVARLPGRAFFSVDVVRRADGALRVVEVGDGQVSDLVGWSVERFTRIWADAC